MKKHFFAVLLVLCMLIAVFPLTAFATDETGGTEAETYVARINSQPYTTLADAINNANDGDTVTLLADGSVNTLPGNKSLTYDLNNHTLTITTTNTISLGTTDSRVSVTIKNGNLTTNTTSVNAAFIVNTGSSLTIDTVTVDASKGTAFFPCGDAAELNVINSKVTAQVYCVGTNAATTDNYNVIITLTNSEFIASADDGDNCPVMINVKGELNIDNCNIQGDRQGVIVRAGTANIADSTIKTMGKFTDHTKYNSIGWGSGNEVPASALTVGNYANGTTTTYANDATVTLTNTTVTGTSDLPAIYVDANESYKAEVAISGDKTVVTGTIKEGQYPTAQTNTAQVDIAVTGGTFTDSNSTKLDVSKYIPNNVALKQNDNGEIVVDDDTKAAEVNGVTYKTLQAAIDAAGNGDTITLLDNVTLATEIQLNKSVSIAGNGHTLSDTALGGRVFNVVADNITLKMDNLTLEIGTNAATPILVPKNNNVSRPFSFEMTNCTIKGAATEGNVTPSITNLVQGSDNVKYTFTDNTVDISANGLLVGIYNGSVIKDNIIDLHGETYTDTQGTEKRVGIMALTAAKDGNGVTITGNTFKNANRALGVDHSTLAASDLTYKENQFIDVRYALEISPTANKDCGTYNITNNYYSFGGTVSAPRVENADADSNKSHFEFGTDSGTEYVVGEDDKNQVKNDVYYTKPTMRPEDLNTYVPPVVVPTYAVTVPDVDNGTVAVSPKYAVGGRMVTITVTPDEGYELDTLTVTDAKGNELALTPLGDGKYSFKMPYSKVTVSATFVETDPEPVLDPVKDCPKDETCPAAKFEDVKLNEWYHDGIHYCIVEGLMNGTSATTFEPDSATDRAMLVTVLYRLEGQPEVGTCPFTDVRAGEWYTDAITWAAENKIVEGYGDGLFGPEDSITREQFATILYRYAKYKGYDVSAKADITTFVDGSDTEAWAEDAMAWAVAEKLINGIENNQLDPQGEAIRAQMATILYRFCENVAK